MSKPDCFGKILPDGSDIKPNRDYEGKVFSFRVDHKPINIKDVQIRNDIEQWEQCRDCDHYLSCYDFSMAKWALICGLK